jgi:hypothetical protein
VSFKELITFEHQTPFSQGPGISETCHKDPLPCTNMRLWVMFHPPHRGHAEGCSWSMFCNVRRGPGGEGGTGDLCVTSVRRGEDRVVC